MLEEGIQHCEMQEVAAPKEGAPHGRMGMGVKESLGAGWVGLKEGLCCGRARKKPEDGERISNQMSWKGWRDRSWKEAGIDGGAGAGERRAVLSGRGSNYSYKSRVKGPRAVLHVLPLISSVLLVSSLRVADASKKDGCLRAARAKGAFWAVRSPALCL